MLGNRAHKGLQPPSNPEERKGLKEAQYAAHVHDVAHPSPLEPAGRSRPRSIAPRRDPRPRPAPPPRSRGASLPSREQIDSTSLEATPRQEGQTTFPRTRPPYGGIKCQPPLHSARIRRRQAAIPRSGCDRSPVRQRRSLLCHSERSGDTVGTCDAVKDVLGTAPATVRSCVLTPSNPGAAAEL